MTTHWTTTVTVLAHIAEPTPAGARRTAHAALTNTGFTPADGATWDVRLDDPVTPASLLDPYRYRTATDQPYPQHQNVDAAGNVTATVWFLQIPVTATVAADTADDAIKVLAESLEWCGFYVYENDQHADPAASGTTFDPSALNRPRPAAPVDTIDALLRD